MIDPNWRTACSDLAIHSYRLIDVGRAAESAALFTDDAEYVTPMATLRGRAEIARVMESRQADTGRRTRHVVGNQVVRLGADGFVSASFALCVYVVSDPAELRLIPAVVGDVEDYYAFVEDRWQIAHRTLDVVAARM